MFRLSSTIFIVICDVPEYFSIQYIQFAEVVPTPNPAKAAARRSLGEMASIGFGQPVTDTQKSCFVFGFQKNWILWKTGNEKCDFHNKS